jgi:hypothetical protein
MGISPKVTDGDVVPAEQGVVIGSPLPPFAPTHVSHKQVEAYPIAAAKFQADGSGRIALKGGLLVDVPAGFASRGAPTEGDMLVRYEPIPGESDGYLSHSPRMVFEAGYSPIRPAEHRKSYEGGGRGLTFGQALEQLKDGDRIAREGWNGKGMWLALSGPLQGREIAFENFWSTPCSEFARLNGGSATVLPCINMKTATGEIQMGWVASQADMLADDWMVVSA